jgi:hypothetical protein
MCGLGCHDFSISPANVVREPDADAVRDGLNQRPLDRSTGAARWKRVPMTTPRHTWRRHLAAGFPLLFAFFPNELYFKLSPAQPVLKNNGPPRSGTGHAAAVIGFDDGESAFIVQDSRGTGFGIQGQWFLPYDLATSEFIDQAIVLVSEEE